MAVMKRATKLKLLMVSKVLLLALPEGSLKSSAGILTAHIFATHNHDFWTGMSYCTLIRFQASFQFVGSLSKGRTLTESSADNQIASQIDEATRS